MAKSAVMQRSHESVPATPASESRDIRGGVAHWPASLVLTANYSFTDFVSTNRVSSKSRRHEPPLLASAQAHIPTHTCTHTKYTQHPQGEGTKLQVGNKEKLKTY